MNNSNNPSNEDLPSTGNLIKSTILAAIVAGVLLVTVVMPSEYAIDPTGIGKVLGLTNMGEIKTTLEKEAAADAATHSSNTEIMIKSAPDEKPEQEAEYKNQGHQHGEGSHHKHSSKTEITTKPALDEMSELESENKNQSHQHGDGNHHAH